MSRRCLSLPPGTCSRRGSSTRSRRRPMYAVNDSVRRLRERAKDGELAYTGDVVPGYARMLDELAERVPKARFIVALGPPPSGNPGQLEAWRALAESLRASEQRPYGRQVFMLPWERWAAGRAVAGGAARVPRTGRQPAAGSRSDAGHSAIPRRRHATSPVARSPGRGAGNVAKPACRRSTSAAPRPGTIGGSGRSSAKR